MVAKRSMLANALRAAAEIYLKDAEQFRENNNDRMAEQFKRQAKEAWTLADGIEQADRIDLAD